MKALAKTAEWRGETEAEGADSITRAYFLMDSLASMDAEHGGRTPIHESSSLLATSEARTRYDASRLTAAASFWFGLRCVCVGSPVTLYTSRLCKREP